MHPYNNTVKLRGHGTELCGQNYFHLSMEFLKIYQNYESNIYDVLLCKLCVHVCAYHKE